MPNAHYRLISDPGHGWLEVPMAHVTRSGYEPTEYSFISRDGTVAYLEEDVDAPSFLDAMGLDWHAATQLHVGNFRRPARRFPA